LRDDGPQFVVVVVHPDALRLVEFVGPMPLRLAV
jgi:hypothetical protein